MGVFSGNDGLPPSLQFSFFVLCEPSLVRPERKLPQIDRKVTIANSSKGIYRGACVAQKRPLLYCCRPIKDGSMWMQIPAKGASPCDGASERVLCEPLAQPQVGKKPRWQRQLLNTQMFLSDKALLMMQRSDMCLPKAVTQHTAQGKTPFLPYQRGVDHSQWGRTGAALVSTLKAKNTSTSALPAPGLARCAFQSAAKSSSGCSCLIVLRTSRWRSDPSVVS